MSLKDYMKEWTAAAGPNNFSKDPPNATLSVYQPGKDENTLTVVEISDPKVEGKDLVYTLQADRGPDAEGRHRYVAVHRLDRRRRRRRPGLPWCRRGSPRRRLALKEHRMRMPTMKRLLTILVASARSRSAWPCRAQAQAVEARRGADDGAAALRAERSGRRSRCGRPNAHAQGFEPDHAVLLRPAGAHCRPLPEWRSTCSSGRPGRTAS